MKTFVIKVSHKEADMNRYCSIELPDYYNKEALLAILRPCTHYRVNVYEEKTFISDWESICSDRTKYDTLENLLKHKMYTLNELVYNIRRFILVKTITTPIYSTREEVVECRPFKLSVPFTIENVCFNGCNTFFYVTRALEVKDIVFVDDDLKKSLSCKLATSGAYYLRGEWKFFRCKTKPAYWQARRIETIKEEVGNTTIREEL